MFKITVFARYLRAALTHAAQKDVRYYLNGVLLDTDAGKIVSTDGHRMLIITDSCLRAEYGRSVIIPRDAIAAALKLAGKACDFVTVTESAIQLDSGASVAYTPIDARYPDWRQVMPRGERIGDQAPATYAPEYIADAIAAVNVARGRAPSKWAGKVAVYQRGNDAAIVSDGENGVIALVMPQRTNVARDDIAHAMDDAHAVAPMPAQDAAA